MNERTMDARRKAFARRERAASRVVVLQAAIIAACSSGPVELRVIQRACNLAAERLFGDISRIVTTLPILPIVNELLAAGVLRVRDEQGATTYEAAPLADRQPTLATSPERA